MTAVRPPETIEEKRARLRALLGAAAAPLPAPDPPPAIVADSAHEHAPFPLTGVQQAYWLGRSAAFELGNISTQFYLAIPAADLDVDRLDAAWNRLIERHAMLRAVFLPDGMQRILPTVPPYRILCEDLGGLAPDARERRLAETRERIARQLFAPTDWPLFELRVSRLSDRAFVFHFSLDLLIADAKSSMILLRELDRLYEDPSASLPPLAISFRDYVHAIERVKSGAQYLRAREYWERRVATLPQAPQLPLARDPSAIAQPRFARRHCSFASDAWGRLKGAAASAGVTPSVLLIAALARVLGRWSRSEHFTLNLTLFNRLPLHPDVDGLVGDFTSLVLLEIDGRERSAFGAFAKAIQSQLWSDIEHRHFDAVDVLRLLNRRASGKPVLMPVVFTSVLGLEMHEDGTGDGPFVTALSQMSGDASFSQTSQVWLDNVVSAANGTLTITWDALDELFPAGVLDAMFAAYQSLLDGLASGRLTLADACDAPVPDAQIARRRAVNDTQAEVPSCLLHEPFRRQAARTPQATAVIQGDLRLDYATVDRCAAAIANALVDRGARAGEPVAVVMTKGWEQAVAVLGILYSGAAYVPIDASLPAERVALLLGQGGARIALTQRDHLEAIAWPPGIDAIPIDRADLARPPAARAAAPPARQDDLAYVIFTSGSTGVPKGVMISHRAAINTIVDITRRFGVGPDDRVLGLSSLSFDLSVYDIFGLLGAGGALVLPDVTRERDPDHWLDLVERHGVTLWNSVPILAQLFVDAAVTRSRAVAAASLRTVMMSGDWIPVRLPDRLRSSWPTVRVVSLGGATEASIWSIVYLVDRVDEAWTSIPYGTPLANQRFHVLRSDFSPAPDWVAGELFIGGVGLADGYWRDDERTRERFVLHPATGERLYRTGDLGRYWPDGTIEFLGRADTQVKVFGHRIELGEIEAALAEHEQVAAAAAAVVGDGLDRRIVAYIVPLVQPDHAALWDGATLIRDPIERTTFTLRQPGLRKLPPDLQAFALAPSVDREAGGEGLRLAIRQRHIADAAADRLPPAAVRIERTRFGHWLTCLSQIPVDELAIPKRYYPSAGSLYPVQAYVSLHDGAVEGLPRGSYYYDPADHRLVRLPGDRVAVPAGASFALFLVSARHAIEPLYGGLADRFARLEAGHVLGLLTAVAPLQGISLTVVPDPEEDALRRVLSLEAGHELLLSCGGRGGAVAEAHDLAILDAVARQSYREFEGPPLDVGSLVAWLSSPDDHGLTVYVYGKPGVPPGGGFGGTLYRFDRERASLVRCADADETVMKRVYTSENRGIHARSAFSLYLVAGSDDDDALVAAGSLGQMLVSLAPRFGLGLCPIGEIASGPVRQRLGLREADRVVYSFEGGTISERQRRRWPLEASARADGALDDVREFLRRKLPGHMVPSTVVPLARLPLTPNGKLDRGALPLVGTATPRATRYDPPRDDVERMLADTWAEVLQVPRVGIHDDFFDLGGNSLSATRIVNAVRRQRPMVRALSLADFFAAPTVAAIAERLALADAARRLEENRLRMALSGEPVEEGHL